MGEKATTGVSAKIGRRDFLLSALAAGAGCAMPKQQPACFDDSLSVLLSDMHVGGPGSDRVHQRDYLSDVVEEILAMRPLPRRVIGFGDLALNRGLPADYGASYPIINRLTDAGIEVYNGLGNHDRREAFFDRYKTDAARSVVPGAAVYRIDTPDAEIIMLDSLCENPPQERRGYGDFPKDVQTWMQDVIPGISRPLFLAAHHPFGEMRVGERPFRSFLAAHRNIVGYIYGHIHSWNPGWFTASYTTGRIKRTLGLPSTGHWGDIGYVTFRTTPDVATAVLHQKDFFFLKPDMRSCGEEQKKFILEESRTSGVCRFSLKV